VVSGEKLGLKLETNSQKGFDAYESESKKQFEIKSRWERGNPSLRAANYA
jgi:hypothetical protein